MTIEVGTSAIDWAMTHGSGFYWSTPLDNHEPPRNWATGRLWTYEDRMGETAAILGDAYRLKDATQSLYLLDDGASVIAHYVAGWRPRLDDLGTASRVLDADSYVILHRFPVDWNANGTRRLRSDDGRPVDFTSWVMGPRRAYHLKLRAVDVEGEGE